MKRILLAGATLLALTAAQPTLSADAPVYKGPAPVAAAMVNWTGFYVGGTVGYGWGTTYQFDAGGRSPDFNWNGAVAGGTLGYNWQAGALVFGIETDISWSGIQGTTNSSFGWGCVIANGCISRLDWFGTVRGRLGYAAGELLPYVTGGLAFGRVFAAWGGGCGGTCVEATQSGWTVGGGLEWAFARNWSAKIEYLYVDLGSVYNATTNIGMVTKFNVARAGVNVRF